MRAFSWISGAVLVLFALVLTTQHCLPVSCGALVCKADGSRAAVMGAGCDLEPWSAYCPAPASPSPWGCLGNSWVLENLYSWPLLPGLAWWKRMKKNSKFRMTQVKSGKVQARWVDPTVPSPFRTGSRCEGENLGWFSFVLMMPCPWKLPDVLKES